LDEGIISYSNQQQRRSKNCGKMPKKGEKKDSSSEEWNYGRPETETENGVSYTAMRKERKRKSKARREKEAILEAEENQSTSPDKQAKRNDDIEIVVTGCESPDRSRDDPVKHTVSIAIPGSILDNAQSGVLKTYLAGQIGRSAAIFNISEIVVFDDMNGESKVACQQLVRILQYLECPQYLRKSLFPIHEDLQTIGVAPPLDIPHHLREHESSRFREGVVTTQPMKKGQLGSFVNVGLFRDILVDKVIKAGTRVTVEFTQEELEAQKSKGKLRGSLVSPLKPELETGTYWGYSVRMANCLGDVFTKGPFGDGTYDIKIGTSERGKSVTLMDLDKGKNFLIVFGGVQGLEYALENDETLKETEVANLFDQYVNTCVNQGSRTIRTEEAILISLSSLSPVINKAALKSYYPSPSMYYPTPPPSAIGAVKSPTPMY